MLNLNTENTEKYPKRFKLWSKKIELDGDCWIWTASLNGQVPQFVFKEIGTLSGRRAALFFAGIEIDTDLVIANGKKCDNKCVNPDHLEQVTQGEAVSRGWPTTYPHEIYAKYVVIPEDLDECYGWTGSFGSSNASYGLFGAGGKKYWVHVWAYEQAYGSVPEGMEVDHLCRTPSCSNPRHLEAVTHAENLRRGREARKRENHCRRGHEYTEENTYMYNGNRVCRKCQQIWKEKKKTGEAGKTHPKFKHGGDYCRKGHKRTEENTYRGPDGNKRECKICRNAYMRERYRKAKEEREANK